MRTSRKLTHLIGLVVALVAFAAISYAQATDSVVQVSDQKAGSLLVFPFYGSDATGGDTRLTITNVGPAGALPANTHQTILNNLNVHLFWLDSTCAQADGYVCFTKFQSWTFKASEWDPVTARGLLIAVAVDPMGYPISYNGLIGNAFVNANVTQGGITERWLGNYGAEAFASLGFAAIGGYNYTVAAQNTTTATLALNNGPRNGVPGYDSGASAFAAEFQSTKDSTGQTVLTVGLNGTIGSALGGNGFENNLIGAIYRNDEKLYSFTGPGPGCQVLIRLSDTNPRILGGLGSQIGTGKTGTIVWTVGAPGNPPVATGAVGLFITPSTGNNAWVGIRGLHKRDIGISNLVMPVFMPTCVL